MKRLTKYNDLYKYLEAFRIDDSIRPVMTTDNNDATSNLATASGIQVLFARPEMKQDGRADNHHSLIGTLAFVLEKGLGSANTKSKENEQYARLRGYAENILSRIEQDTTSGACNLLSGLDLVSAEIIPVISVFGGWLGYSIEMEFE